MGYGAKYMYEVFKDWGGKDMKDHVTGLSKLEHDPLIDSNNRFLIGRSYGGFMTLSLITRHPDLWNAGCDMFGPYDLSGFYYRLPPTWQKGFNDILGHPERDKDLFHERSPKTYLDQIKAPLLIVWAYVNSLADGFSPWMVLQKKIMPQCYPPPQGLNSALKI